MSTGCPVPLTRGAQINPESHHFTVGSIRWAVLRPTVDRFVFGPAVSPANVQLPADGYTSKAHARMQVRLVLYASGTLRNLSGVAVYAETRQRRGRGACLTARFARCPTSRHLERRRHMT